MPKVVPYTKGSIIFFEGDRDERIYILQSGVVVLTQNDLETGNKVNEQLSVGEFFGVKNALAHKPRMETATALTEVQVVQMTVPEFEKIVGPNQNVILKMLKVFSTDLRVLHKRTEEILKNDVASLPCDEGMKVVAQCFYDEEKYQSCCDVCTKILSKFPGSQYAKEVGRLLEDAKNSAARARKRAASAESYSSSAGDQSALKQFSLPMFERFSRNYSDGEVIISEFEPGDCFYLIQSGQVQLEKCIKGAMKNLDILRPGEFFGEMAILDNSPRSATCIAKGEVKCLEFNKDNFRILVTGNPQIAMILLKLFCRRIYDQRRRFGILVIKDLPARVADVFLMYDEMSSPEARSLEDKKRVFYLTISDVAHWAGISHDEAKDELTKLVSKGKIEIFDDRMKVMNIMDFRRVVDNYFAAYALSMNLGRN